MEYCPHCMAPNVSGRTCPNCGGDLTWTGQKGMELPAGTALTGGNGLREYWVGASRGKGGFGITYIAMETTSHRKVAIKEYFPVRFAFRGGDGRSVQTFNGQDEAFKAGLASFLKEAKMLLSQEDLPSVVEVIDFFQANGTAYLVMEYLDGLPLHAYMQKIGGTIPAGELLQKLQPVLRDLGQLHQRGILHRDISPDNLMMMPNGTIKVLDFGSARSMDSSRSMTTLMKEGFSPIEQYRSTGQGPYSDVYALAATIYYCLTGIIPPGSVDRLANDTLQPPRTLGVNLSAEQEKALLWGLSIQPEARPQSMEAFHNALYSTVSPLQAPPAETQIISPFRKPPASGGHDQTPPSSGGGYQAPPPAGGPVYRPQQPPYSGPQQPPYQPPYPGSQSYPPKKKSPLPIILAVVGVIIVGVLALGILGNRNTADAPATRKPVSTEAPVSSKAPTEKPEAAPTDAPAVEPTEAPAPEPTAEDTPADGVVTGTLDDYTYEIHDGTYAVLTGYTGYDSTGYMPDDIDGILVTEIADNAFQGVPFEVLNLPLYLERIGSKAFQNCTSLHYAYAYSSIAIAADAFDNTTLQDVILCDTASAGDWIVAGSFAYFADGDTTPAGEITDFQIISDGLYAATDQNKGILLDLIGYSTGMDFYMEETISGADDTDVPVEYIADSVLINVGSVNFHVPDNYLVTQDQFNSWISWKAEPNTLAEAWLLSNQLAFEINLTRPADKKITPNLDMVRAAMVRAQELTQLYDFNRPDGTVGYTALEEQGVSYLYTIHAVAMYEPWSTDFADFVCENFAIPIPESHGGDFVGEYYTEIGSACFTTTDDSGNTVYYDYVFVMIPGT